MFIWDLRGRDSILAGFTTTYAIGPNHHLSYEFESRSWRSVLDTTFEQQNPAETQYTFVYIYFLAH